MRGRTSRLAGRIRGREEEGRGITNDSAWARGRKIAFFLPASPHNVRDEMHRRRTGYPVGNRDLLTSRICHSPRRDSFSASKRRVERFGKLRDWIRCKLLQRAFVTTLKIQCPSVQRALTLTAFHENLNGTSRT